jgi:LmbE family N-acetylglucosaminyl deacetylase
MTTPPLYRRNADNRPHRWLKCLADADRPPIDAADMAILVAHPGDETIGCGAQLRRLRDAGIIVLTDGATREFEDGDRAKLEAAEAYAATRLLELQRALQFAGLGIERLLVCGTSDQQSVLQLPALCLQIAAHVKRNKIRCLLTLAYEGGHPDRDSAAFVAHVGAALLARQNYQLHLLEMPISHRGPDGAVRQRFIEDPMTPIDERCQVKLTPEEQRFKRTLIEFYATQSAVLKEFHLVYECFRAAPRYDLTAPPNWGRLLDEHYAPSVSGAKWLALARDSLRQLGMTSSWY